METLKKFITDKKTETWLWLSVNSFLVLSIDFLTGVEMSDLTKAIIIASLSALTKWINVNYLKK